MASVVCPRCGARSPVRLRGGEACAACLSQDAWGRWEREGKLVIDVAAIEASEARRRGVTARRLLGLGAAVASALLALGLAALVVRLVVLHVAPRPVGSLAALADALRASALRLSLCGVACLGVGLAALRLRAPRRGRLAIRASFVAAIVAGGGALLAAAFTGLTAGPPDGFAHASMPRRSALGQTTAAERATNAAVVIVAPDADGDARGGGLGSGVVVAVSGRRALVVTCSHVAMPYAMVGTFRDAASAQPVWTQLADGREAAGRVVWVGDPPLDVALVEVLIDAPPEPVTLAPATADVDADEPVFFVPNPYRHGFLVEHGKVLRREVHDTPAGRFSLLFSDLPVQPGDSGSGLFDLRGRLIGLNTWSMRGPLGPHGVSLPGEAMAEVARMTPAHASQPSPEISP